MAYPSSGEKVTSVSGIAEITDIEISSGTVQVSCVPISGSSIVTLTVKPALVDDYQAVEGGTIDLSAPTTLVIDRHIDAIKAEAADSGDSFKLIVVG